jgi:periplasmic protein TonB
MRLTSAVFAVVIGCGLTATGFAQEVAPAPAAKPQYRGPALDSPEVYKLGKEITPPKLVREVKPKYSAQAMRERIQGGVKLACVVLTDGTVGDTKVIEKLHPDLDDEAVRTLRQWIFTPGTKDGVAVPVQVDVQMTFTLRAGPGKQF